MPLLHSVPHRLPSLRLSRSPTPFNSRSSIFFTAYLTERALSFRNLQLRALPSIDQELLQILTESDDGTGEPRAHLPAIRSYETDLACFTLIGSVRLDQALVAAAADGGDAAEEHLASGSSTMVVETVFPGGLDERSTISTRLFLPAEMVKEKARQLRSSLARNILRSKDPLFKNILAMTFRQVVMQRLWSFQLSLFCPGTERNMEDVDILREARADFIVNSSDEKFISSLAEVISYCALESTRSNCIQEAGGLNSKSIFHCFQKPQKTSSNDSSISICRISETEIAKEARSRVETYNLTKGKYVKKKMKYAWWFPTYCSGLDLIGGPGFGLWTCDFIPAYKLEICTSTFKDLKLEGFCKLTDSRWEVLLTHNQMVELANVLDMYYEDQYTMPNKRLLCNLFTKTQLNLKNKNTAWKLLFWMFAGGCIIMIFGILAQFSWPKQARKVAEQSIHSISEFNFYRFYSLESSVVENLCFSTIKRIKDELGWSEDIMMSKNIGVWTGTLPSYLRNRGLIEDVISSDVPPCFPTACSESRDELSNHIGDPLAATGAELQKTSMDIASYQAVFTSDGKLIGFQPRNRVAVNHWSSNPLAKSLYGAKKLSPGFLEPRLSVPPPNDAVPIELLMSIKPESRFALARPMQQ